MKITVQSMHDEAKRGETGAGSECWFEDMEIIQKVV